MCMREWVPSSCCFPISATVWTQWESSLHFLSFEGDNREFSAWSTELKPVTVSYRGGPHVLLHQLWYTLGQISCSCVTQSLAREDDGGRSHTTSRTILTDFVFSFSSPDKGLWPLIFCFCFCFVL